MSESQVTSRLKQPVIPCDHTRGPETAAVTVVEYGDYECPICGEAYSTVMGLMRRLGPKMRFVYLHFPMTQTHPHAFQAAEAAEAAEAAAEQRKFWEMHDTLFTHQDALDFRSLVNYSIWIGLDLTAFREALVERRFEERVRQDFVQGVRSGVNGTPTLFINDLRYDGPRDLDSLLAQIEAAAEEVPL